MTTNAVLVDSLAKNFPPSYTGWKTLLQPLAKATVPALVDISLRVKSGESLSVIGANGAGKSTLLRILSTLLLPTRGRAEIGGCDAERDPAGVRRKIGYHTGGDAGFYQRLSARENLEFFAALNNLAADEARRAIARVAELMRLGKSLGRQVRTLSTGTVQRLGLARAMLHAPPVLLLDEPTRSVDPLTAADFRKFLKRELIEQRGTTVVFASHTLEEVALLADRVAILDAGRLVACDTPSALLQQTGAPTLEAALRKLTPVANQANEREDGE